MQHDIQRLRRIRQTPQMRDLFRETSLSLNDLALPIFVEEGA
ncbi:porphobilinogen synthase, partial [Morganella morganii]